MSTDYIYCPPPAAFVQQSCNMAVQLVYNRFVIQNEFQCLGPDHTLNGLEMCIGIHTVVCLTKCRDQNIVKVCGIDFYCIILSATVVKWKPCI